MRRVWLPALLLLRGACEGRDRRSARREEALREPWCVPLISVLCIGVRVDVCDTCELCACVSVIVYA